MIYRPATWLTRSSSPSPSPCVGKTTLMMGALPRTKRLCAEASSGSAMMRGQAVVQAVAKDTDGAGLVALGITRDPCFFASVRDGRYLPAHFVSVWTTSLLGAMRYHGCGDAPGHPLRILFGPRRSGFLGHARSFGVS